MQLRERMQSRPLHDEADADDAFDQRLPRRMQVKSSIHFTPIAVARHAARWLAPHPGTRVLDVGAGPGKFCVVAAREVPGSTFTGVELRPHLVRAARRLATQLAVPNVAFVDGDALDLDWTAYDAFYFYNPFAEQLYETAFVLDRTLDLDPSKFIPYVMAVRGRLEAARIGTRVVTYHGLGAPLPECYDLVENHPIGTDSLDLWIKRRDRFVSDAVLDVTS